MDQQLASDNRSMATTPQIPEDARCLTLHLENLHCGSCVGTIQYALSSLLPATYPVLSFLPTRTVTIYFPPVVEVARIFTLVSSAGFTIDALSFARFDNALSPGDVILSDAPDRTYWAEFLADLKCKDRPERERQHRISCTRCRRTVASSSCSSSPVVAAPDLEAGRSEAHDGPFYEALISIGGMTCSVCSGKIHETLTETFFWIKSANINLMSHSATIAFTASGSGEADERAAQLVEEIEDLGYEATLEGLTLRAPAGEKQDKVSDDRRTVSLLITGSRNAVDVEQVVEALERIQGVEIDAGELRTDKPIVCVRYRPRPPDFTVRTMVKLLENQGKGWKVSVYHPPTIEERARELQRRERRGLLKRLGFNIVCAIPTLLIGIVWMMLVPASNAQRRFFNEYMWSGSATRGEWALLFLATPVMVYSAGPFHRHALAEIVSLWKPGSKTPVWRRFVRFGSMNLLISLGVTISYLASVVMLGLAAGRRPEEGHGRHENGHVMTYFDSTVFLCMFLLMGRYLEAYSKAKTADAVSAIEKLRPTNAYLLSPCDSEPRPRSLCSSVMSTSAKDDLGSINTDYDDGRGTKVQKIPPDFLEVGDTVMIPHGSSPPTDCTIAKGATSFDESSLTGESRPVGKKPGDPVYAGTVNHGSVIHAVVTKIPGESMIDDIVDVVREGQSHPAPIERIADRVTGYFVPVICLLAVLTFIIWLSLGLGGALPEDWLDTEQGGWPFWALSFAIAVFVVACPCGIGLAAPCAMHVGSSLAASLQILAKGGGEAFQTASKVSCVVFDKTGTLTMGDELKVEYQEFVADEERFPHRHMAFMIRSLEETSTHPLARAICASIAIHPSSPGTVHNIEELPGRGVKGTFIISGISYEALIGSPRFLAEHPLEDHHISEHFTSSGQTLVLFAARRTPLDPSSPAPYTLTKIFSLTSPLRPSALPLIQHLQAQHIAVYMLTGDSRPTALSIARLLHIPDSHVVANVLPTEKAAHIKHLQSLPSSLPPSRFRLPFTSPSPPPQQIVAMVGDGINDAPALATADIGVAVGSGADLALHSADFILVSSELESVATLLQLSKKVVRRVKENFGWACMFNVVAVPLAAGVLYPVGGIRLSPVWAALAMAGSSVSVVVWSLGLRTRMWGVGFRAVGLQRGGG